MARNHLPTVSHSFQLSTQLLSLKDFSDDVVLFSDPSCFCFSVKVYNYKSSRDESALCFIYKWFPFVPSMQNLTFFRYTWRRSFWVLVSVEELSISCSASAAFARFLSNLGDSYVHLFFSLTLFQFLESLLPLVQNGKAQQRKKSVLKKVKKSQFKISPVYLEAV